MRRRHERARPSARDRAEDEERAASTVGAVGSGGSVLGGLLVLALGGVLGYLVASGSVRNYVQPVLAPVVAASAGVLALLGLWTLTSARRRSRASSSGAPRPAAWLLLVPVVLAVAAPPPLGSALLTSGAVGSGAIDGRGANQQGRTVAVDGRTGASLDPAAPAPQGGTAPTVQPDGPAPDLAMLNDYWAAGRGQELDGQRVTLLGFAAPTGTGDWWLGRFAITCCAADALPVQALLQADVGESAPDLDALTADQWYEVTGTIRSGQDVPVVVVESLREVPQPKEPYL